MTDANLGITDRFKTLNAPGAVRQGPGVRLLCVEDEEVDFELMQMALRAARFAHTARRVEDEAGMRAALAEGQWDAVISDHNLPLFSSAAALKVLRESEPDTPFLIVSGAIGEDAAVAAMQSGADDYLMKHSLKRLAPAIEHAMASAAARRQRRATAAELRASLDYLRTLVTASPVGIVTLNGDGRVTLFNAAAEEIFQISRTSIMADPQPFRLSENRAAVRRLREAVRAGPVRNLEEAWLRRDGKTCDFSFSAASLGAGVESGVVVFVTDVSEHKRIELARHETETRFAAITANLPGVVFQMLARPAQRKLLVPYVSAGANRLFGVSPEAFLAAPESFIDCIVAEDRADLQDAVEQAVHQGAVLEGQWRARRTDGTLRWVQLSASAREAGGGNWLFDGIITDVTAQKEIEQELTRSREELRQLTAHTETVKEEERRAVAREIHDDIGSTLTGMKADLAWLGRRFAGDAEVMARIEGMKLLVDGAVQTANRIVQELRPGILDYGIAPALEWQAKDFSDRTGIRVSFETNDEELLLDLEQSTALFRVFQESLTNVSKYAGAARVETELFTTSNSVTLEVRDDGAGLAPGDLTKPASFGVRGMMERARALGGWLDINGPPGRGTTVMLSIPRRRPHTQPEFTEKPE